MKGVRYIIYFNITIIYCLIRLVIAVNKCNVFDEYWYSISALILFIAMGIYVYNSSKIKK
jgi:phosphate starvation-inducible membrane PsiE